MNIKIITLFFLFIGSLVFAQSKTNLEMIYGLIDSSAGVISNNINNHNLEFNTDVNSPNEYSQINQRILTSLVRNKVKLNLDSLAMNKINYSLSQVTVNYSDLFRDGLFGDYLLERNFILSGDFSIQNSSKISSADIFNYTITDTIPYSNFSFVENNSLPFTKGNIPEAPFLPSILEPVVAITAVVVTVILFFSVRSR
ncbi:MAG: hypothetical protein PF445_10655 [Melioribacteraceae bacterium]|jgi:hypothetical protein|nr:hypothetical protein [Melioribacteraceae bacterium]